jgi:cell filamentation protein
VAARQLAALYADLDHAHGFYEGNSRTLREFTRSLAEASGFTLAWIVTGVEASERIQLYIARDAAVPERAFPGPTEQRATMTARDKRPGSGWNDCAGGRINPADGVVCR